MGDINLRTKINNLDERVSKVEESGGGTSIIVDSELSSTSTNPVQNKVITETVNRINNNVNKLTEYEKLTTSLPTQSDYTINTWDVRRKGSLGVLSIDITCLTKDEYPQGNTFINIAKAASTLPLYLGLNQILTAKNGDYKPVEISLVNENNELILGIRGGSKQGRYSGIYTFMFQ